MPRGKRKRFMPGEKISGITFLEEIKSHNNVHRKGLFECHCGKKFISYATSIFTGKTKSCGCYMVKSSKERFTLHGLSYTPLYKVCSSILDRCNNEKNKVYKYYGGRGIKCYRGKTIDIFMYIKDNIGLQLGKTIDRIDNNKGYEPGNIRWATRKEQSNNTSQNHIIEYNGKVKTLTQWSEEIGMDQNTLRTRIKRGRTIKDSIERSVQKRS